MRCKYSGLIILLLFLFIQTEILPQSAFRRGFKIGMETLNFVSGKNGGFNNEPGYELGLFTAVEVFNNDKYAFLIKIEISYNKFVNYRLSQEYAYTDYYNNPSATQQYIINDEKYTTRFVELGIIPEYFFILSDESLLSFTLGPSFGFGGQTLEVMNKNNLLNPYYYAIYDEYLMVPNIFVNLNMGVNYYYKIFFAGLRYKHISITGDSRVNMIDNVSLEGGLAF